ncbi:TonB-dependent receptor [Sphingobacterium bovistauri]|uniref:TonB-dependent receptor plug domain-containing protein n=1 Tax=Sphingobacterium bovistauri TaxID=2781959 RepID=A0ABS7Z9M1_9SPHI|nr:TonB-dependent receptor plug domain-containing protein [Sphingobacterium bovistauri]MCA5006267.1 TonB-dependent receptor plug domain-containing protein [Sphingobacterium bovistauri]
MTNYLLEVLRNALTALDGKANFPFYQKYKRLFYCSCLLLVSNSAIAQDYTLSGYIKNSSNHPISGVTVKVDRKTVLTDEFGFFKVEKILNKNIDVIAQSVGYHVFKQRITLKSGLNSVDILMLDAEEKIEEVIVTGLTKSQLTNRMAFNVTSIDATKYYNSTLNIGDALDQVPGVRVREQGGLGSNMNLAINGFSGNHIRLFIDGIPMDNMGSTFQLNTIPINLADNIEVFKGVVPIWLGSDALGGAVNIITNKSNRNFIDASYSYGSFNTHRTTFNGALTAENGLTFEFNAFQNYSDNNYKVFIEKHNNRRDNYTKDTEVERFHDKFHNESVIANIGVVNKLYADRLLIGITLGKNYKEIQTGARMESVFGAWHRRGNIVMPTLKYSKDDLIKGLDVMLNANINLGTEQTIDTVAKRFDWFGDTQANLPPTSGERSRTMYKYKNRDGILTSNLNYNVDEKHVFIINNVFNTFNRSGSDILNPQNNAYEYAKISQKNVLGFGYQYKEEGVWSANFFGKLLSQSNKNGNESSVNSIRLGYGTALSYFFNSHLQLKGSFELTNRMATPYELFGDVENQDANTKLKPESSNNINLGLMYQFDVNGINKFGMTAGIIYRNAKDFIYQRLNQNQSKYIADNREGVRTVGADLELSYAYKSWLTATSSWTYQYLQNMQKYEDGYTDISPVYKDQMPNIPYFFGNLNVNVHFPEFTGLHKRLTAGYNLQYVHDFYLYWPSRGATKNTIPKQLSHDVNVVYSLYDGRYNIGIEARNLTDERLFDNFSMQKPGRAFYLNLRYFINRK